MWRLRRNHHLLLRQAGHPQQPRGQAWGCWRAQQARRAQQAQRDRARGRRRVRSLQLDLEMSWQLIWLLTWQLRRHPVRLAWPALLLPAVKQLAGRQRGRQRHPLKGWWKTLSTT